MAQVLESKETVTVKVSKQELQNLLIAPAKQQGFIDFDPTRVAIREDGSGHVIVFEKVTGV